MCAAHDRLRHAVLLAQVDVALVIERLALRMGGRARRAGGRFRLERAGGENGGCQHRQTSVGPTTRRVGVENPAEDKDSKKKPAGGRGGYVRGKAKERLCPKVMCVVLVAVICT